jgi:hypothetical protein
LQLDAYKLQNKLSRVGVGGVLDQMKIRLTQPQVELELGLSLAKNKNFHFLAPPPPPHLFDSFP